MSIEVRQQAPAQEMDSEHVVLTGSIGSTVKLDFDRNEAHKVYQPSRKVRLLYWLAFQAPFPYVANHAALEAAKQRRLIVDLLTKFWFDQDLVADVIGIRPTPEGAHDFITELVRGEEPQRTQRAQRFLKTMDRHFIQAGLPTWQVTPYNPHAITNFIETPEGAFRIINLESSLVAFLHPLSRILPFIRAGLFPSFDDIDVKTLRSYIDSRFVALSGTLGKDFDSLVTAVDRYEVAADLWHSQEPRYLNRGLRAVLCALEWPFRRGSK